MYFQNLRTDPQVAIFSASVETELVAPCLNYGISTGFPPPLHKISLTLPSTYRDLICNPASTFFGRVRGDSMIDAGIENGDLLIIDKSLTPQDSKIAVCCIDGKFTIKRIRLEKDCCWLMPANPNYRPIKVTEDNEFLIWGIVFTLIVYRHLMCTKLIEYFA